MHLLPFLLSKIKHGEPEFTKKQQQQQKSAQWKWKTWQAQQQ